MSFQFKRKRRNTNLRKNDDLSSEDEVKVVSNESKKPAVCFVRMNKSIEQYAADAVREAEGGGVVMTALLPSAVGTSSRTCPIRPFRHREA